MGAVAIVTRVLLVMALQVGERGSNGAAWRDRCTDVSSLARAALLDDISAISAISAMLGAMTSRAHLGLFVLALVLGCGGDSTAGGEVVEDAMAPDASSSSAFDAGPTERCATPGALEEVACAECGRVERFCNAEGVWAYGTCLSPSSCAPDELCETPGALETVACGSCGARERFCNVEGRWVYGECMGTGACTPGATRTAGCGRCGSRTERCSSACEWDTSAACEGEGTCSPGESRRVSDGCVPNQTRLEICDSACTYQPQGGCEGPIVPICPTDTMLCGDRCVDVRSDEAHCGACERACPAGAECVSTRCECIEPLLACGAPAMCIDTSSDDSHCGGCGNRCPAGSACVGGKCTCPPGQTMCDGACRDLSSDPGNCGFCGASCLGGGSCVAGRCSGPWLTECQPRPVSWPSCDAYCASLGRSCATDCGGTGRGGAYGRYFDSSCTMINGIFGSCSSPIEGSSSIEGFRCCCVP